MIDAGSIAATIGSLKAAADIAKGFLDLKEAAGVQGRVIELQSAILAAQSSALAGQSDQLSLLEEIRSLKAKMAELEAWNAEKKRYDLKNVGYSAFAYVLKEEERGSTPPHWVCTNCYEGGHAVILQYVMVPKRGNVWTCPSCKNTIEPGTSSVDWPA
jgi:rubrerythrin